MRGAVWGRLLNWPVCLSDEAGPGSTGSPDGASSWTDLLATMSQAMPTSATLDPSRKRLEADLLALLQDFERRAGRCVSEVRIVNASTYEGGRCPAAVHVRLEE